MIRQRGLTIVEFMIALALSSMITAGLGMFFSTYAKANASTNNLTAFEQTIQGAIDLINRDMRRAGYWASARNDIGAMQPANPFAVIDNPSPNCILYSYDFNRDGALQPGENHGFLLAQGTLSYLDSLTLSTSDSKKICNATLEKGWAPITDATKVFIDSAVFSLKEERVAAPSPDMESLNLPGFKPPAIITRSVDYVIHGNMTADPSIAGTYVGVAHIFNNVLAKDLP
jgi:type II secretory pathway component PulJ